MITTCRSCGLKNLTEILSLGNIYLSNFYKNRRKPLRYPLTLAFCSSCSLVQLLHTTPQSVLYTDNYGYKSGINQTMRDELKDIVKKTLLLHKRTRENVVCIDIGANDGTLLKNYPKSVFKIGIEPVKKFAKECEQYADIVINDFFNITSYQEKAGDTKVDIITAISCFYDIDDPNKFLSDITHILKEDGILVVQQNYLKSMIELNAFDNIVHEHLEYYSMMSMQNLLTRHNLEIFDVELRSLNGGSFRTYISFKGKRKIAKSIHKLLEKEKEMGLHKKNIYKNFSKNINSIKRDLHTLLRKEIKDGKKIYLYGASTRGNTLLQYYNLDHKLIEKAVERNPEKWGKKIASVGIPIISEEQARKEKPNYMIVLPWFFKDEFLKREKDYLKNGGHFIFPLPKLETV